MLLKRTFVAFLTGLAVLSCLEVCENCTGNFNIVCIENPIVYSMLYYSFMSSMVVIYYLCQEEFPMNDFKILLASQFCGFLVGFGIIIMWLAPSNWTALGLHFFIFGQFHMGEFIIATIFIHNMTGDYESFMIRVMPFSFIGVFEYICESLLFPGMKEMGFVSYIGLLLYVIGEICRKASVINLSSNFNHVVQLEHKEGHVLVNSGIHSIFRHPSYFALSLVSIARETFMMNPVAIITSFLLTWWTLKERVILEDITLLTFFGPEYVEFQKKTPTGIPFVDGYDYFVRNPDAKLNYNKDDKLWYAEDADINNDMIEKTKATHDPISSVVDLMKKLNKKTI